MGEPDVRAILRHFFERCEIARRVGLSAQAQAEMPKTDFDKHFADWWYDIETHYWLPPLFRWEDVY